MASDLPNVQTNVPYNPLPRSARAAEHYEMSENPAHDLDRSQSNTPLGLPPNIDDLPPGAAAPIPRFFGQAVSDGRPRFSYADSFDTSRAPSVAAYDQSSLHALDPAHDISAYPARYSSPHISDSPYRDNPEAEPAFYPPSAGSSPRILQEKQAFYASPQKKKRKGVIIGGVIGGILVLAIGAAVAVYFTVIRKHGSGVSGDAGDAPGSKPSNKPANNILTSGGDGTTVTMEDGNTFTYSNKFGGIWVQDPSNPFNNSARPQSWSPALNEPFNWGVDKIRG
jgi:glucan 1,3-beta-glucosidase